jgi:hypothetical protein
LPVVVGLLGVLVVLRPGATELTLGPSRRAVGGRLRRRGLDHRPQGRAGRSGPSCSSSIR